MDVAFECIPCTVQSCLRLLDEGFIEEDQREGLLRQTLGFLATADWKQSPPALARELHAQLRQATANVDPYREIKHRSNQAMLTLARELRDKLASASDPFDIGLRHRREIRFDRDLEVTGIVATAYFGRATRRLECDP